MIPGGSVTGSRERFSGMKRKDSAGGTAGTSSSLSIYLLIYVLLSVPDLASMPRKPSLSTLQVPGVLSPTSPRTRVGYNSNFDGVLNNGESWMSRRRFSEASLRVSNSSSTEIQSEDSASKTKGIAEVKEEDFATTVHVFKEQDGTFLSPTSADMDSAIPASHSGDTANSTTGTASLPTTYRDYQEIGHSPVIFDLAAVEWSYKDPTGQVQGKHDFFIRNSVIK